MACFRPFPFSCVPPRCIWRRGMRRDMREVDADGSVVIMKTKEVAESWHSSFPIHLGGLYPLCRHHLCHEGQQDSFMTHPEKEKPLSPATAAPRRGDHGWDGGRGGYTISPPLLIPLPAILQAPSCQGQGWECALPHQAPSSGAVSPGGATPNPCPKSIIKN